MLNVWKVATLVILSIAVRGAEVRFNRDIRPLLSDRCFSCHGPDKASRKAKLRLDQPESAFAARNDEKEHAIVPGKPEESLLVRRIFSTDPDELMPPPKSHLTLSAAEKKLVRDWIAQGAKYEPHWAFIAPAESVAVPQVKNRKWPRNEIDRFVLARLESEKLKPSREADKTRWLRRVTLDLNGVPPTPGEVDAFLSDTSKAAYETVVDRLLKSTRFGQRMASPWLDGARYADSYGYQSDQLSPTWPYRDWVVNALNRNLPYDQFLTEQLAGDLLPNATREQKLATAFNRLHRQTNEGGSVEEEWRLEYVADRVQTASTVFLGLNFECARCHDHKFDPIMQRDFYSMSAFFNNIDEHGTYNDTPHVPTPAMLLPTAEQEAAMTATAKQLDEKRIAYDKAIDESTATFQRWKETKEIVKASDLIGAFMFDGEKTNQLVNEVNRTNLISLGGNSLAPGKSGNAVRFTGDDTMRVGGVMPSVSASDQYSVVFWLQIPEALTNGLIFHATEGTDTSYYGTEFLVSDSRLRFVIKRFWPGNAIAIETKDTIAAGKWNHIAVTYDGSADARGMRIFIDGKAVETTIVRNNLSKPPGNGDASLQFGARSRSSGLKEGLLDELKIFSRPLASVEIQSLFNGKSIEDAVREASDELTREYFNVAVSDSVTAARDARAAAARQFLAARNPVQETSVMEEMRTKRETYLLDRGRYDALKTAAAKVERTTPAFLPAFPPGASRDRLGLAQWLTRPDHPLTARVAVNRYWQILFGRGLVSSVDNFGAQGMTPTHPELLDWLARDFINSGWNTKTLLKKIVLSATYRQDSVLRPDLAKRDPENRLLARGPSQRLSAEAIRDTALFASGLLDEKAGGPPVSPYMPGDLWRESNSMSPGYKESVGGDLYRRSVYTVWKRTAPMPNMIAFDAPSREVCQLKRTATGTPQQAFILLNDPQFVEAARVLAEEMLTRPNTAPDKQVGFVFTKLTGRNPDAKELKLLMELWLEQKEFLKAEPERATKLLAIGKKKANANLNPIEVAAATQLTQAILNLDATIWKR
jgi:hypothetical protein